MNLVRNDDMTSWGEFPIPDCYDDNRVVVLRWTSKPSHAAFSIVSLVRSGLFRNKGEAPPDRFLVLPKLMENESAALARDYEAVKQAYLEEREMKNEGVH